MLGRLIGVAVCLAAMFGCGRLKHSGSSADGAADTAALDATDATGTADTATGVDVAEVGAVGTDAGNDAVIETRTNAAGDTGEAATDTGTDAAGDVRPDASTDADTEVGAGGSGGNHTTDDGLTGI